MIKITENKARGYGIRGMQFSLPQIFVKDNRINAGDIMNVYRTKVEGDIDALVIIPKNKIESCKQNNKEEAV